VSNPYRILGLGLCLGGVIFAPISYFIINSVPLTAVGISAIIIGFTCIALANTRPYISPEACQLILKTGMENTAALLEELGLRSKAVYLPSAMRNGHPQALIPLVEGEDIQWVREKIPGRLIVRYGLNPEDMAIAVTTPGSINIDMLETKPGPTAGEIEAAAVALGNIADQFCKVFLTECPEWSPVEDDGSCSPGINAHETLEKCGLTCAVRSDNRTVVSLVDSQRYIFKDLHRIEGKTKIMNVYQCFFH